MNDKITVCLGKGGQREMAESFARKNNVSIMDKPGEHLTVMFDSRGVSLTGYGLTYQGDFEGMLHRVTNGRLSHEMLVRAVKTEGEHLKAIDATAGMGEDGFLLAAYGYEVTLYEQNPVIAALLKDALDPNLVQTLEHNPAIIHGGPFANIAHGCNSAIATRLSLKLADYVVTEAGFGADLGAEKFLDIKCRYAGLHPAAVVLVATVRALKSHGGVAKPDLGKPNAEAVRAGSVNLARHIENLQGFGLPVCVAINAFPTDTAEEMDVIYDVCSKAGVPCALSEVFAKGGEGGKALAETVLSILDDSAEVQYTYELDAPLTDKIEAVATKIYRAGRVSYTAAAKKTLDELTALGYGKLPVCIAKTQYSFSDNAKLTGAPEGHTLNVREVRLSAGAGFVVVVCGSIMTMPGLPKHPAAMDIDVDVHGKITGLF